MIPHRDEQRTRHMLVTVERPPGPQGGSLVGGRHRDRFDLSGQDRRQPLRRELIHSVRQRARATGSGGTSDLATFDTNCFMVPVLASPTLQRAISAGLV